jgi:hypothetical protein
MLYFEASGPLVVELTLHAIRPRVGTLGHGLVQFALDRFMDAILATLNGSVLAGRFLETCLADPRTSITVRRQLRPTG